MRLELKINYYPPDYCVTKCNIINLAANTRSVDKVS